MNLFEFAKKIGRTIYIEARPNGEHVVSFGTDCDLIVGAKRIHSVHGRGTNMTEAIANFTNKLKGTLEFPKSFDHQYLLEVPNDISPL